jgi:hypothetical protein
MRSRSLLLAITAAILALPTTAPAAGLVPLAPASAWESSPIHAASPPGEPSRLFVVERGGGVRIVSDGVLQPTPFLTVPNVDTAGERGLLSIAFSPDYPTSGLLYVFTVAQSADAFGEAGDVRVVEYRRSANPNLADPASARLVLREKHSSAGNHNGGQIAFGPEGLLYVTIGDAANSANAQTLTNDLGKVLRIDPRLQPGGAPFGVPASNPFAGTPNAKPEIYARGLRNPYRASFAPNGDLVLPDVGEGTWEEVNVGRATGTAAATTLAGANLGWPNCEGLCTPFNPAYTDPVFQYGHTGSGPAETTGCAIIGGYVVRDRTLAGLTGRYLYGDTCRRDLRTLDLGVAAADPRPAVLSLPPEGGVLIGFGEDGRGCVYAMTTATVYRVAPSSTAAAACPEAAAGASPDTTRPRLTLSGSHRQPLRRALRVFASCDEACSLRASGTLRVGGAKASAAARPPVSRRSATAGQRLRLAVRIGPRAYRKARLALQRGRKVTVPARIAAADGSGNSSRGTFRIKLRPPRA